MSDHHKANSGLFWSGLALLLAYTIAMSLVAFVIAPPLKHLELASQELTRFVKGLIVATSLWVIFGSLIYIFDRMWKDRLEGKSILQWLFKAAYKKE